MDDTHNAGAAAGTTPLPARFADRFDEGLLEQHGATLIAIDAQGVMLWFNRAWQNFAHDNDGVQVLDRFGVGANYYDGIAGELREFFRDLFGDALRAGRVIEMEYECSSAEVLRQMRLRALPIADAGLLLEHSCIKESPQVRLAREAFVGLYENEAGFVVQCSNCRRVRRHNAGHWDWVSDWIRTPHPATSHGICEVCHGFYYGAATGLRRGPR